MAPESYKYKLFNLTIETDFKFHGLEISEGKTDIHIKENSNLEYENKNKKLQKLSLSESRIENKKFITTTTKNLCQYKFFDTYNSYNQQLKILHQALPSALFQRRYFVLHGSAFLFNGEAVVITGPSGYGKSETLDVLSKRFKIITDDIVGISVKGSSVKVLPGIPITAISHGNKELFLNDKRSRYFKAYRNINISTSSRPLSKIIILDWGDNYSFNKIDLKTAFSKIMGNTFRTLPSNKCKESEKVYLMNYINVLKKTKQYIFSRKRGDINDSINFLLKNL